MDHKDGPTAFVLSYFNLPGRNYSRKHVRISERGCALELSAEADTEGLVAFAR